MKWNFLIPDKHNWQEGSSLSFPMASEEYSRHKKNAWWCASSPSYNLSHSLHRPPTPAFQLLKCSAILPTTTPFKSSETHSKMISCAVLTKSQGTTDQHHLFTAHVFRKIMLPADSFHFQLLFPPPTDHLSQTYHSCMNCTLQIFLSFSFSSTFSKVIIQELWASYVVLHELTSLEPVHLIRGNSTHWRLKI